MLFREKRGLVLALFFFVFAVGCYGVLAADVNMALVNSTFGRVTIEGAQDLYGYEVALNYTDALSVVSPTTQQQFLGAGASYGASSSSGVASVYGSKLDSTRAGTTQEAGVVNTLFTFSYSGTPGLGCVLLIKSNTSASDFETTVCPVSEEETSPGETTGETGSTGGAGSFINMSSVDLSKVDISVNPETLIATVFIDFETKKYVNVTNNGPEAVSLDIALDQLQDIVSMRSTGVTLNPGESRAIELIIGKMTKGVKVGNLNLFFKISGKVIKQIPIIINPMSENFLFDTSLTIPDQYKQITPGSRLRAQMNLLQVGPQEKVDIVATYTIKDFSGKSYLEESETFYVLGDKTLVKDFSTKDLPIGKYVLSVEIVYPGAFASSSAQFEVVETKLTTFMIVVLIGIFVAFFVVTLIWARRKGHKHRRR